MIARIWRGATRTSDADAYVEYLEHTGLSDYRSTPGNMGAYALRRTLGDSTEFITLSLWRSREDVRSFAGTDIERARFYPEDGRFLVERDLHVTHYEVVIAQPGSGGSERSG